EPPPFTALLADPDALTQLERASQGDDITRDVVHEARKGVRSVLDEARAEIEALSSEKPSIFGAGVPTRPAQTEDDEVPAPFDELSLDASLESLDFLTRDLPIPTLAGILGSQSAADSIEAAGDRRATTAAAPDPLAG